MKFFNWMQNKFINGGQQDISKPNGSVLVPASCVRRREPSKEELIGSDGGLLTIGTFGNHQDNRRARPPPVKNPDEINLLTPDLTEFTPDEFGMLQNELTKLLKRKPKAAAAAAAAAEEATNTDHDDSQPLDRFLNCPSSLSTMDRTISSSRYSTNSSIIIANDIDQIIEEDEEDDIDRTIRIIIGRCKEISKMNKGIFGKKSVSFLLKKIFLCSSGHFAPAPAPGLRDTIQQSRMEKLLRTLMISKKMYQTPENGYRASSTKRILESRYSSTKEEKEDDDKRAEESHKWVKTDSEYIVLDLD